MKHTRLPLVLALVACGPATGGSPESETSTTDAPTSSTGDPGTSSPSTSGMTAPGTTTASTTAMETTGEPSTGTTGDTDTTGFIENCSLFEQNCPDGQKCMPYANDGGNNWNATRCVPIDPDPDAVGEPCTVEEDGVSGIDSCDGTSMCFDVDQDTLEGTCFAFCGGDESDPTCPNACDFCTISGDGVLTICLPTCEPLAQECPPGDGCYFVESSQTAFICTPDVSEENGAPGDACEFLNQCDPGSMCLGADFLASCESTGCCSPFCTVGDPTACEALPGTECLPLFEETPACTPQDIGVCATPR